MAVYEFGGNFDLPVPTHFGYQSSFMPHYPVDEKEAKVMRLVRAYQKSSNRSLLDRLVRLNMGIVYEILNELNTNSGQNEEDLLDIAVQGLSDSFRFYNLDSEDSFTEFANSFIRQKLGIDSKQKTSNASSEKVENFNAQTLKEKTLELLEVYRHSPTLRLRNHLVHLNIGLVRKEAYHWVNQCQESFEDLMQVGSLGLIRAIERFDITKRHAFSSFAVPYIRGEIQHYLRDKSPTIRIPRRWQEIISEANHHYLSLKSTLNREPSEAEIAEKLNIPLEEWQEIKLAFQNRSPLSLDTPIYDDDETTASLGDLLPDTRYRNFQLAQEDSIRLQEALQKLELRTKEVLEFVFIKEFTYKEAAEALGISAVTVSRQVKKGLKLLREVMTTPID